MATRNRTSYMPPANPVVTRRGLPKVKNLNAVAPKASRNVGPTSARRRSLRRRGTSSCEDESGSEKESRVGLDGKSMLFNSSPANAADNRSNAEEPCGKFKFAVPEAPRMTTRRLSTKASDKSARLGNTVPTSSTAGQTTTGAAKNQLKINTAVSSSRRFLRRESENGVSERKQLAAVNSDDDDEISGLADRGPSAEQAAAHTLPNKIVKAVAPVRKRLNNSTAVSPLPSAAPANGKVKKPMKPAPRIIVNNSTLSSPRDRRSMRRHSERQNSAAAGTDTADNAEDADSNVNTPASTSQLSSTALASSFTANASGSDNRATVNYDGVKIFRYTVPDGPELKKYAGTKQLFGWCPSFEATFNMKMDVGARPVLYGYVEDHHNKSRNTPPGAVLIRTRTRLRGSNSELDADGVEEERIPLKRITTTRVLGPDSADVIVCGNRNNDEEIGTTYRLMGELTKYDIDTVLYDDKFLNKFRHGFTKNWRIQCNQFFIDAFKAEQRRRLEEGQHQLHVDDKPVETRGRKQRQLTTGGADDSVVSQLGIPRPSRRSSPRAKTSVVAEQTEIGVAVNDTDTRIANDSTQHSSDVVSVRPTTPPEESNIPVNDGVPVASAAATDNSTGSTVNESPCSLALSPPTSSSSPARSVAQTPQPSTPSNSRRSSVDVRRDDDIAAAVVSGSQSSPSSPSRIALPDTDDDEDTSDLQTGLIVDEDDGTNTNADEGVAENVIADRVEIVISGSLSDREEEESEEEQQPHDEPSVSEPDTVVELPGEHQQKQLESAVDAAGAEATLATASASRMVDVEPERSAHADQSATPPASPAPVVLESSNDVSTDDVIERLLDDLINTTVETAAVVATAADDSTTATSDEVTLTLSQLAANTAELLALIADERVPTNVVSEQDAEQPRLTEEASRLPPDPLAVDQQVTLAVADVVVSNAASPSPRLRLHVDEEVLVVVGKPVSSQNDATPLPPPRHHRPQTADSVATSPVPAASAVPDLDSADDNMMITTDDVSTENSPVTSKAASLEQNPSAVVDNRVVCQYEDVSDDDGSNSAANAIKDFETEISKLDLLFGQTSDDRLSFQSEDYIIPAESAGSGDDAPRVAADLQQQQPPSNGAASEARNASCSASPPASSSLSPATPMQVTVSYSHQPAAAEAVHEQQASAPVYYAALSAAEPTTSTFYDVSAALQTTAAYNLAHPQQSFGWAQSAQCATAHFGQPIAAGVTGQQQYYQQQQQQSLPVVHIVEPMQVDVQQHDVAAQESQQQRPQVPFYDDWQVRYVPEIRQFLSYPVNPPANDNGHSEDDFHDMDAGQSRKAPLMQPLQPVLLPEFGQYQCAADDHQNENQNPFACRDMFAGKSQNFFGLYSSLFQSGLLQKSHLYGRVRDIEPIDLETFVRQHVRTASGQSGSFRSSSSAAINKLPKIPRIRKPPNNSHDETFENIDAARLVDTDDDNDDDDGQNDSDTERHRNYHATLRHGGRAAAPRRPAQTTRAAGKASSTTTKTPSKRQLPSPSSSRTEATGLPSQRSSPPKNNNNKTAAPVDSTHPEVQNDAVPTFTDAVKKPTTIATSFSRAPIIPPFKRQKTTGVTYSPRPDSSSMPKKPPTTTAAAKRDMSFVRKNQLYQQPRIPIAAVAAAAVSDMILDKRLTNEETFGSSTTQYYSQAAQQPFSAPSSSSNNNSTTVATGFVPAAGVSCISSRRPQHETSSSSSRRKSQVAGSSSSVIVNGGAFGNTMGSPKRRVFMGVSNNAADRHRPNNNNLRFLPVKSTSTWLQPAAVAMDTGEDSSGVLSGGFSDGNNNNGFRGSTQFFDAVDSAGGSGSNLNYFASGVLSPEAANTNTAARCVVQRQPLPSMPFFS